MDDGNWPSPETLDQEEQSSLALQPSGDPSAVAPPVPIPNTEVKRCSPDDSVSIGYAKVGRRQSYAPFLAKKQGTGRLFVPSENTAAALCLSCHAFGGVVPGTSNGYPPRKDISAFMRGAAWELRSSE